MAERAGSLERGPFLSRLVSELRYNGYKVTGLLSGPLGDSVDEFFFDGWHGESSPPPMMLNVGLTECFS